MKRHRRSYCLEDIDRPDHVDGSVVKWVRDARPDIHLRRKMRDYVKPSTPNHIGRGRRRDVDDVQRHGPRNVRSKSGGQIIDDRDVVALLEKSFHDVRSDEARTACHQNFRHA